MENIWLPSLSRKKTADYLFFLRYDLCFSTAFNPQTDEQLERTIQTLEDMLRACVMDFKGSWERHLPLVEFAYNSSFQASIGMAPYKALYGRLCQSPICWTDVRENSLLWPDLIRETTEKVQLIRQRLMTAQSRKNSYADRRTRLLTFNVGDHIFLKIYSASVRSYPFWVEGETFWRG